MQSSREGFATEHLLAAFKDIHGANILNMHDTIISIYIYIDRGRVIERGVCVFVLCYNKLMITLRVDEADEFSLQ